MERIILDLGVSGAVCLAALTFAKKYFFSKLETEKQKEKIKLDQNTELFNLFKQSYNKQESEISNLKGDLIEMKRMIADNSYMGKADYCLFIKTFISLMFHNIECELRLIVERNHINENSLDLTNKKIKNFIERTINENIGAIEKLHFYKNVLHKTTSMLSDKKDYIIEIYSNPIEEYAHSKAENSQKKDHALINISEITKYLSNKLIIKFQDTVKNEIY